MRAVPTSTPTALVADLGGTNVRLALAAPGAGPTQARSYASAEFPSLEAAVEAYLAAIGVERPAVAVVAAAGPVADGEARLTNGGWVVSERALENRGFRRAQALNDFEALAHALDALGEADLIPIGGPALEPRSGEVRVLIGAGTGLGIGGVVRDRGRAVVVTTEGGHAGFAPADAVEVEILQRLMARFGRVSTERLLSGPGLQNLYATLAEMAGRPAETLTPEAIVQRARLGACDLCEQALDRFCRIYGAAAGDAALMFGARGGVLIGGGIAPDIVAALDSGGFREAFEAKGRLSGYMAAIPTAVIAHPYPALLGCAVVAAELMDAIASGAPLGRLASSA